MTMWVHFLGTLTGLFCVLRGCCAWQQWEGTPPTYMRDGTPYHDFKHDVPNPPGRRGHTLTYFGKYAILFGGRGTDTKAFHQPKTYELLEDEGNLFIEEYNDQVVPGHQKKCKNVSACADNDRYTIEVGVFYNDVWAYDIECERYADDGCVNKHWMQVDGGAPLGGCQLRRVKGYGQMERCTHPTERYGHTSAKFGDRYLVIFGGYSQFCEDYCDDVWVYDMRHFIEREASWPFETYTGELSFEERVSKGYIDQYELNYTMQCGTHNAASAWLNLVAKTSRGGGNAQVPGPGRIWRHAVTMVHSTIFVHGGYRLWHGYDTKNSRHNRYNASNGQYEKGGYLNALWSWNVNDTFAQGLAKGKGGFCGGSVVWKKHEELCTDFQQAWYYDTLGNKKLRPDKKWSQRFEELCISTWPEERAGHKMVHHGGYLYIYGGYRTPFPYPNTLGPGSGWGTAALPVTADLKPMRPFPSFPFFLDDMWRYNLSSGYWEKVAYVSAESPGPRMEHDLVVSDDVLILIGGYVSNHHYDDLWYFNVTTKRWLQKKSFVHALYPKNCTEGGWVLGQPTRVEGYKTDGLFGRAAEHVYINYTRRQRPGWDGCRDRHDGDVRATLPQTMQWKRPTQRSHHSILFDPKHELILLFGGHGFEIDYPLAEVQEATVPATTFDDLWQFRIHQCPHNCSNRGECRYGHCYCNHGYYGIDCSNISCPGDFCYYDEYSEEQVCKHCCSAPWTHTDNDTWQRDIRKVPCDHNHPGESNGKCDGYGTCQCRPPFITDDCSVRDCPNNCSFNGWCSVEYPVSRCMCNPGYEGIDCSTKLCLNNCSYPNGLCQKDGSCVCKMTLDPYVRTRDWRLFGGMDCSMIVPYASASSFGVSVVACAAALFALVELLLGDQRIQ